VEKRDSRLLCDRSDRDLGIYRVVFDPPVTVEECRLAGRQFWGSQVGLPRVAFERVLVDRLVSLGEVLAVNGEGYDEAIAAFDQAAWTAWEARSKHGGQGALGAIFSID
jgi:hypothetical protein